MTNTDAMFWRGETLSEQLPSLIEPFAPERVDCAAYTLSEELEGSLMRFEDPCKED